MITQERADILTKFLTFNEERGREFLALSVGEASVLINALGYDFTYDEISAYGQMLRGVGGQSGELDFDALDEVAGGAGAICIVPAIQGEPLFYPPKAVRIGW